MPFDQFTIEQLAGDLLPGATSDQTHRHRLPPQHAAQRGGRDRPRGVPRRGARRPRQHHRRPSGSASTVGCAQCHDHKYDPISQKDYYRLFAFFNNADYSVFGQSRVLDHLIVEPELDLPTPEQAKRREALRREADSLRLEIDGRDLEAELAAFARDVEGPAPAFVALEPVRFEAASGASFRKLADGSLLVAGEVKEKDTYAVTVRARAGRITAFRLDALPDPSLPQKGPGRSSSGAFVVTGLSLREKGQLIPLARASADVNEKQRPASSSWTATRGPAGESRLTRKPDAPTSSSCS